MNEWTITALGMGTVFIALIGLSFTVSLFPLIFRRKYPKPVKEMAPLPQILSHQRPAPAPAAPAVQGELVAVLAAAVAAASGLGLSQFRISSIEEAGRSGGFSTPAWGHADRYARSNNARQ